MERKSCKYCGASLPEDALFCPVCEKEQIEKLQLRAPRPGRRRAILAALLRTSIAPRRSVVSSALSMTTSEAPV